MPPPTAGAAPPPPPDRVLARERAARLPRIHAVPAPSARGPHDGPVGRVASDRTGGSPGGTAARVTGGVLGKGEARANWLMRLREGGEGAEKAANVRLRC